MCHNFKIFNYLFSSLSVSSTGFDEFRESLESPLAVVLNGLSGEKIEFLLTTKNYFKNEGSSKKNSYLIGLLLVESQRWEAVDLHVFQLVGCGIHFGNDNRLAVLEFLTKLKIKRVINLLSNQL